MKEIERTLRERIGLDPSSIGASLIHRSVRLRMKSRGLKTTAEYLALLRSNKAEWDELQELVVVTETWFFRDQAPFGAAIQIMRDGWLPVHPIGQARFLSLPCSSGEEPYSLAMALLEARLSPERFQIDAVDISRRALAAARKGIYGKNSFRGKDLAFRSRYFQAARDGYFLLPSVRQCVRFHHGNILNSGPGVISGSYDFIFCRNLLIYFDEPTRRQALARINQLLAPDGVLFVGAAEQPLVLDQGFVSAHIPMAFACRKASRSEGPANLIPRGKISSTPAFLGWTSQQPALETQLPRLPQKMSDSRDTAPSPESDLDRAQILADAGKLAEAAQCCEAHLRLVGASARAYYLLGLVRDAMGDPAAQDYYRKALYLDPSHYESLLQLAMWLEKNGEAAGARRFKNRALRLKQQS